MIKVYECVIEEWDMKAAGLSVVADKGLISEDVYYDLLDGTNDDKKIRQILIGLIIKDEKDKNSGMSELLNIISEGVKENIEKFLKINRIKEKDVLEVAHDAVFLKNPEIEVERISDFILFRQKGRYYLTFEFEPNENSNRLIRIYKTLDGLKCRGAKLNTNHIGYNALYDVFYHKMCNNSPQWNRAFSRLKKALDRSDENIIDNVDNNYLLDIISDYLAP